MFLPAVCHGTQLGCSRTRIFRELENSSLFTLGRAVNGLEQGDTRICCMIKSEMNTPAIGQLLLLSKATHLAPDTRIGYVYALVYLAAERTQGELLAPDHTAAPNVLNMSRGTGSKSLLPLWKTRNNGSLARSSSVGTRFRRKANSRMPLPQDIVRLLDNGLEWHIRARKSNIWQFVTLVTACRSRQLRRADRMITRRLVWARLLVWA